MWNLPSAKPPRFPRSGLRESGTLRMICKPQKLGSLEYKVGIVRVALSFHQEAILGIHSLNMLICHIPTIHELQKHTVWQLYQAFLCGSRKYSPFSYCPSPLPGTLATCCVSIQSQTIIASLSLVRPTTCYSSMLCSARLKYLISSAIVLALADILLSYRFEINRPRCRSALT